MENWYWILKLWRWSVSKGIFLVCCAGFAAVLGGTWGGLVYLVNKDAGVLLGVLLFLLGFMALARRAFEPEEVMHDRRFNDPKGEL